MGYEFVERETTPGEYNALRTAVGWSACPEEAVWKGLAGSLYTVCLMHGGRIVGMGRVIGDGALVFYIQDIIVLPEHQGKGLGAGIMDRVMAFIHSRTSENSIIGLMAAKGKEGFYRRYGFVDRPNENHGCGMIQFARGPGPS